MIHHFILRGKKRSRSFRLFFFRRKMIFIKCPQRIFSLLFHQSFLAILLCLLTTFIFTRGEKSYWLRQLFQQSRNHKSTAKFPFFLFVIRENSRITKRKLKKFSYCANNNRVWFVSIITTVHIDMTCVIPDIRYDYVYRRKTAGETFDDGPEMCLSLPFYSLLSSLEKWHSRLLFHFIFFFWFLFGGGEYYYEPSWEIMDWRKSYFSWYYCAAGGGHVMCQNKLFFFYFFFFDMLCCWGTLGGWR